MYPPTYGGGGGVYAVSLLIYSSSLFHAVGHYSMSICTYNIVCIQDRQRHINTLLNINPLQYMMTGE